MANSSTGGYRYESPETRALGSITQSSYDYQDQSKTLIKLTGDVSYMAAYMTKMQKGIDQANQNILQQIQSLIEQIVEALGGHGDTGFDFGDFKYVLRAIGAMFGWQNGVPLPLDIFAAVRHFVSNYILPISDFSEFVNELIDSMIATIIDILGDVPILGEAAEQLGEFLSTFRDLILAVHTLLMVIFDTFGITEDDITGWTNFWQHVTKPLVDMIAQVFGPLTPLSGDKTAISAYLGSIDNPLIDAFIQGVDYAIAWFKGLNFGPNAVDDVLKFARRIQAVMSTLTGQGWIPAALIGLGDTPNLLSNPNTDSDAVDWNLDNTVNGATFAATWDATDGHTNPGCIQISGTGTSWFNSQSLYVVEKQNVKGHCYYKKTSSAATDVTIQFSEFDTNGTFLRNVGHTTTHLSGSVGSWTLLSTDSSYQVSSDAFYVSLEIVSAQTSGGVTLFDDFSIIKSGLLNSILIPDIQKIIDAIVNGLGWLTGSGGGGIGNIITDIGDALGHIPGANLVGALNTALTIFGNHLSDLFNGTGFIAAKLSGVWADILGVFGPMSAANIATLLTSWTKILSGLSAPTVADLLSFLGNWGNIFSALGAWSSTLIGNFLQSWTTILSGLSAPTVANLLSFLGNWGNIFSALGAWTTTHITNFLTNWGNLFTALGAWTTTHILNFLQSWGHILGGLGGPSAAETGTFLASWTNIFNAIGAWSSTHFGNFLGSWSNIFSSGIGKPTAAQLFTDWATLFASAFGKPTAAQLFTDWATLFASAFGKPTALQLFSTWSTFLTSLGLPTAAQLFTDWATLFASAFGKPTALQLFSTWSTFLTSLGLPTAAQLFTNWSTFLGSLGSPAAAQTATLLTSWGNIFSALGAWTSTHITNILGSWANLVSALGSFSAANLNGAINTAVTLGGTALSTVATNVANGVTNWANAISNGGSDVSDAASLGTALANAGINIGKHAVAIVNGVFNSGVTTAGYGDIENAFAKVVTGIFNSASGNSGGGVTRSNIDAANAAVLALKNAQDQQAKAVAQLTSGASKGTQVQFNFQQPVIQKYDTAGAQTWVKPSWYTYGTDFAAIALSGGGAGGDSFLSGSGSNGGNSTITMNDGTAHVISATGGTHGAYSANPIAGQGFNGVTLARLGLSVPANSDQLTAGANGTSPSGGGAPWYSVPGANEGGTAGAGNSGGPYQITGAPTSFSLGGGGAGAGSAGSGVHGRAYAGNYQTTIGFLGRGSFTIPTVGATYVLQNPTAMLSDAQCSMLTLNNQDTIILTIRGNASYTNFVYCVIDDNGDGTVTYYIGYVASSTPYQFTGTGATGTIPGTTASTAWGFRSGVGIGTDSSFTISQNNVDVVTYNDTAGASSSGVSSGYAYTGFNGGGVFTINQTSLHANLWGVAWNGFDVNDGSFNVEVGDQTSGTDLTSTSGTYTTISGLPSATFIVPSTGRVKVEIYSEFSNASVARMQLGLTMSGANTRTTPTADNQLVHIFENSGHSVGLGNGESAVYAKIVDGLNPGDTTFGLMGLTSAGTMHLNGTQISVGLVPGD